MIIKNYEIDKVDFLTKNFTLVYGLNEGHKKEVIKKIIEKIKTDNVVRYEEREIINNPENFYNSFLSKSFFEKEKIIIIDRSSDKIISIINEIILKNIKDIHLILNSGVLEKKSKLRSLFEKEKNLICIAFYQDNNQTLTRLAIDYFNYKKISVSNEIINQIVNKCQGDREALNNELQKIELFSKKGKKINLENITKLINLSENHEITELVDHCLSKNKKKTINILNESNFNNDDCILITRVFLNKSKKLLKLTKQYEMNKNLDLTIANSKPPIFWKDKEKTKQQIKAWSYMNVRNLIYKLNNIELVLKKNFNNSVYIITDFLIDQSS
tara:strand:- start:22 stop:1005 length:984 start_codon:yes stop_codon:yes gene_type:complete